MEIRPEHRSQEKISEAQTHLPEIDKERAKNLKEEVSQLEPSFNTEKLPSSLITAAKHGNPLDAWIPSSSLGLSVKGIINTAFEARVLQTRTFVAMLTIFGCLTATVGSLALVPVIGLVFGRYRTALSLPLGFALEAFKNSVAIVYNPLRLLAMEASPIDKAVSEKVSDVFKKTLPSINSTQGWLNNPHVEQETQS